MTDLSIRIKFRRMDVVFVSFVLSVRLFRIGTSNAYTPNVSVRD